MIATGIKLLVLEFAHSGLIMSRDAICSAICSICNKSSCCGVGWMKKDIDVGRETNTAISTAVLAGS